MKIAELASHVGFVRTHSQIHMHIPTDRYISVYMYVCISLSVHTHTHIYIYIYIYIYICIESQMRGDLTYTKPVSSEHHTVFAAGLWQQDRSAPEPRPRKLGSKPLTISPRLCLERGVTSGVISRVFIVVTHIRGLITQLMTTHEPPSRPPTCPHATSPALNPQP